MPKKAHFAGVQRVKQRDAKGNVIAVRNYHRATKIRLPDDYGSPAFAIAWAKAETSATVVTKAVSPRETYGGLCSAFAADDNPDWSKLAPNTQRDYRKCMAWMNRQGADPRPAAGLTQERCGFSSAKAVKELGHRQGVYILQFNRRLYGWVLERAARQKIWGDKNPWAEDSDAVEATRGRRRDQAQSAVEAGEELEVLFAAPLGLRRAYVLGVSGLDGSTMVGLTWDDWNSKEGGFSAERVKTGAEGYINVLPLFRMFLEEGERPSAAIVTNQLGQPFKTANTLPDPFKRLPGGACKEGRCRPWPDPARAASHSRKSSGRSGRHARNPDGRCSTPRPQCRCTIRQRPIRSGRCGTPRPHWKTGSVCQKPTTRLVKRPTQPVEKVSQNNGEASWRSGDAEDCKSLHPGSIPGEASNFRFLNANREIRTIRLALTSRLPTRIMLALSSLEDTPPSPKRLCGSLWLPPSLCLWVSSIFGVNCCRARREFRSRNSRSAIEPRRLGGYTPASNRAP